MNKNKLNPACVFEQFAKINTIPRPSKHEEKMIAFLKEQDRRGSYFSTAMGRTKKNNQQS